MVTPRLSRSARDRKPVHLLDGLPGAKLMLRTAALGIAIAAFVAGALDPVHALQGAVQ